MISTYKERYNNLNEEQKKAVDTTEGPVIVIAGPGTGKTELLSVRVAHILETSDVSAANILCLTFTDSASVTMRKRLSKLIGPDAYSVGTHTFHSFASSIISKYPEYFYGGAQFSAVDSVEQVAIVSNILSNLSHSNPLSSYHPQEGYVYVKDILSRISEAKKAGLTPSDLLCILLDNSEFYTQYAQKVNECMSERVSKKTIPMFKELYISLLEYERNHSRILHGVERENIARSLADTLGSALDEYEETSKTSSVSEWKKRHISKDGELYVFTSSASHQKMKEFCDVYTTYEQQMHEKGLYDFDDMILTTLKVLESEPSLLYDISEQYHYILVDEFQDTNDAQLGLLLQVCRSGVHEGRPNILVVGDDDQAIYRFQGAKVSHLLSLTNYFKDPEIITLTKNYRSTKEIIQISQTIASHIEERASTVMESVNKNIQAHNDRLEHKEFAFMELENPHKEYSWIAQKISDIKKESPNETIAVIARRHADLEHIAKVLTQSQIPILYERKQHVLSDPVCALVVLCIRVCVSIATSIDPREYERDLVTLLHESCFGVPHEILWRTMRNSYDTVVPLFDLCRNSENTELAAASSMLYEIAEKTQTSTLLSVFDILLGNELLCDHMFPIRSYYLNTKNSTYYSSLSALSKLHDVLKSYKNTQVLFSKDLLEYISIIEENSLRLSYTSYIDSDDAAPVTLLTSHAAKGMEFDTVFILSLTDSIWVSSSQRNKISLPENLRFSPEADTYDDKARLLYVAATRAQHRLVMSYYKKDAKEKETTKARFLTSFEGVNVSNDPENSLIAGISSDKQLYVHASERKYLESLLESYTMSITHLATYLDIIEKGPQVFLEDHVLRFPKAKSAAGSFGSAIHWALDKLHSAHAKEKMLPRVDFLKDAFKEALWKEKLIKAEYEKYLKRGYEALDAYYATARETWSTQDLSEVSFAYEAIIVGEARVSGVIDRIKKTKEGIVLIDFKTGKSPRGYDSNSKKKSYTYERQIDFYTMLCKRSKYYSSEPIIGGELHFIEENNILSVQTAEEKTKRIEQLTQAVWKRIMNLDFEPRNYGEGIAAIQRFEQELLE